MDTRTIEDVTATKESSAQAAAEAITDAGATEQTAATTAVD